MEYIEREAAVSVAMQFCPDDDGVCSKADADLREMLDEIEAIPAADVVPARHGRWIISRTDRAWNGAEYPTHCKCNQCGREIPYLDMDAYCPKCGALMDKDGDGE